MGNCMTQEMPQPQRPRVMDYDEVDAKSVDETRSTATTPTKIVEASPNGHSPDGLKKSVKFESKDPTIIDGTQIKEPPVIKRVVDEPTEEKEDSAKVLFIPFTTIAEKTDSDSKQIAAVENLGSMNNTAEQPSDSDSTSSQASREAEPGSLTLVQKPAKKPASDKNSAFKKSSSLFLCLSALLLFGSIMMKRPRDIQSFLIRKPMEKCTGNACQFLSWVHAYDGLCSLDRNLTVPDVRHTLCPPYGSNSTISEPVCNFASWLEEQNRNEECSPDVQKRVMQVFSKYASPFGLAKKSTSMITQIEDTIPPAH